jgi:hypothetical protein
VLGANKICGTGNSRRVRNKRRGKAGEKQRKSRGKAEELIRETKQTNQTRETRETRETKGLICACMEKQSKGKNEKRREDRQKAEERQKKSRENRENREGVVYDLVDPSAGGSAEKRFVGRMGGRENATRECNVRMPSIWDAFSFCPQIIPFHFLKTAKVALSKSPKVPKPRLPTPNHAFWEFRGPVFPMGLCVCVCVSPTHIHTAGNRKQETGNRHAKRPSDVTWDVI